MMAATRTFTVTGGIDIGNGYVKASLGDDRNIDLPSGIATLVGPNPVPLDDAKALSWAKGDIYNELDLSFDTPVVPDRYRKLFGRSALNTTGIFEEFQIGGNHASKAEQPLSYELIIGLLAGWGIRQAISANGGLPDDVVTVKASIGLALPIKEYIGRRRMFAQSLRGQPHMVTMHTFTTPVVVKVDIKDVDVIAEGASAQFAIIQRGKPLMDAMLKDVRAHGMALKGVTADDLMDVGNFIGIDIGEGTVNFPVFTNHAFNAESSRTLNEGYGTALTRAMETMENNNINTGFTSRKQLADFLAHKPSDLKRHLYDTVKGYVDEQVTFLARTVTASFTQVMTTVGALNEVAYVYGGGSGPMKDQLYPMLLDVVSQTSDSFPILYLDASYSRNLNREGLVIMAAMAARG